MSFLARHPRLRRAGLVLAALLASCLVAGAVAWAVLDRPLPDARPGPSADALAREVQAAVGVHAWRDLGAVAWRFGGFRDHLWDRRRGYARVVSGADVTLLRLGDRSGRAWDGDREITDPDARRDALDAAYAAWVNDAFWLNPFPKLFDPGTSRGVVAVDGDARGLLVTFGSGGVTPGDSYLFEVAPDGTPRAWRMWVSVLPIGGVRTTWEGWTTLPGGARVATAHGGGPFTLELEDVRAGPDAAALVEGDGDPFAPLEE